MKTTKISWFQHLCKILLVLRSHVGEEDSGKSNYFCTFPAMISDWRLKFHAGTRGETDLTFPFGFVQVRNSTKIFSLTIRNRQFIFQFEKRTWFYVCFFSRHQAQSFYNFNFSLDPISLQHQEIQQLDILQSDGNRQLNMDLCPTQGCQIHLWQ